MSDHQCLSRPADASYPTTTPSQCHDAPLTLGNLHSLVQSSLNSSDDHPGQCDVNNDAASVGCVAPNTPQRTVQPNNVAPLTPLANLKVLMAAAAASSALEGREGEEEGGGMMSTQGVERAGPAGCGQGGVKGEEGGCEGGGDEGNTAGRKLRSLALLCKRFLSIVENDIGTGNEFSLDTMAQKLGTNRRRIYDIINILESVELIVKQSKNWYCWCGRGGLLQTLAKLKAMAADDPELVKWFKTDARTSKENVAPPNISVARQQDQVLVARQHSQSLVAMDETSQDSISDDTTCDDAQTKGGRWDKSLGILCQKFIMLFLLAPNHELTLDLAGNILIPEDDSSSIVSPATHTKTKVRRLYDIANVLTTLELIRKKTFLAANQRKMPGYVWCGPSVKEIETVPVCRKREFPSSAGYPRKTKGTALERKSSFSGRPFLHQYEVKDSTSAPSTPCKSVPTTKPLGGLLVGGLKGNRGGGGIRRSLSFGGQSSTRTSGGCGQGKKVGVARNEIRSASPATVRPLLPKAVDYLNEMREFEKEMKRHSHRYPHVLTIFQDFIHRYQVSLEQAVASGRTILPKPPSPPSLPPQLHPFTNFPDPLGFSTPQTSTNPTKKQPLFDISPPLTDVTPRGTLDYKELRLSRDDSGFQSGNSLSGGALMTSSLGGATATSSIDVTGISKQEMKTAANFSRETEKFTLNPSKVNVTLGNAPPIIASPSLSVSKSHHTHQTLSDSPPVLGDVSRTLTSVSCPLTFAPSMTSLPTFVEPTHTLSLTHKEKDHKQVVLTTGKRDDTASSRTGDVSLSQPLQALGATSATSHNIYCGSDVTQQQVSTVNYYLPQPSNASVTHNVGGFSSSSPIPLPLLSFTQGTLQSPQKPVRAKSQAFVRVEDFLSALTAQSSHTLTDPRLAARGGSLPTGVQPFSPVALLSHLLTSTQGAGGSNATPKAVGNDGGENSPGVCPPLPLNPSKLVNQKPISATSEALGKTSLFQANNSSRTIKPNHLSSSPVPHTFAVPSLPPLADVFLNPNTLLRNPAQFFPPQTILPNTTPGFVPLTPNIFLPQFSAICVPLSSSPSPNSQLAPLHPATPTTPSDDGSPPKRAKLE